MIIKHINLIRKISWEFTSKTGMEFEELFAEACLACLEAEKDYRPEMGGETTFIWVIATNHLKNVINKEMKGRKNTQRLNGEIDFQDENYYNEPERKMLMEEEWKEFIATLSPEAQYIYHIIKDDLTVYLPIETPKKCRGEIVNELRNRGWSWGNIWGTFRELKDALS